MKVITKEDHDAYFSHVVKQGALGALLGVALCVPAHYTLRRVSAYYRALPIQRRTYGSLFIVLPSLSIAADLAALEYEQSKWTGDERRMLDVMEAREGERWSKLNRLEKAKDWAAEHKWKMIMGGWAVSMGVAMAIVSRNRHQTFTQKLVQARMWAQGLTVGTLVTSAIVTGAAAPEAKPLIRTDHSWKDILAVRWSETESVTPQYLHIEPRFDDGH